MGDRQAFSSPRYSSAHGTSTGLRGKTNEFQVVVLLVVWGHGSGLFPALETPPAARNNATVRLLLSAWPGGWALGCRGQIDAVAGGAGAFEGSEGFEDVQLGEIEPEWRKDQRRHEAQLRRIG